MARTFDLLDTWHDLRHPKRTTMLVAIAGLAAFMCFSTNTTKPLPIAFQTATSAQPRCATGSLAPARTLPVATSFNPSNLWSENAVAVKGNSLMQRTPLPRRGRVSSIRFVSTRVCASFFPLCSELVQPTKQQTVALRASNFSRRISWCHTNFASSFESTNVLWYAGYDYRNLNVCLHDSKSNQHFMVACGLATQNESARR